MNNNPKNNEKRKKYQKANKTINQQNENETEKNT